MTEEYESEETKALTLYLGDEAQTEAIAIPIRQLIVNEPVVVNYVLRNDSRYPIDELEVEAHGNDDVNMTLNSQVPDALEPGGQCDLVVTWTLRRLPKVHGDMALDATSLEASYNIVMTTVIG